MTEQSPMEDVQVDIPVASIAGQLWREELDVLNAQRRAYFLIYSVFEAKNDRYMVSAVAGPNCVKNACSWRVARLTPDHRISAAGEEVAACGELNRLFFTDGKLLICGVEAPLPESSVKAPSTEVLLSGRYAYYQAATAAQTDNGPQSDADCRKFIASDLYDADGGEHLLISGNRWDDNQDVSAVTGNVAFHDAGDNGIPFTIDVESEGQSGPAQGTIKRVEHSGLTIAFLGGRTFHYCKVGW